MAFVEDILSFQPALNILPGRDVSSGFHSVAKVEDGSRFFPQYTFNFLSGPHVKHAFAMLSVSLLDRAVRVQCGIECALGTAHLTQRKIENVTGHIGV